MMLKRLIAALKRKPVYRYRDAVTGKMVSKAYAEANPSTTVRELV